MERPTFFKVEVDSYPDEGLERDRWIIAHRANSESSNRQLLDPLRPYAFVVEQECSASGETVDVATIFLTNRECPWRCLMCDLWRNTLSESVPKGAITSQIDYALQKLPKARQIKLYNSGSFFDNKAIPPDDYSEIARRLDRFDNVIVESHPALIGDDCLRFRDLLKADLEVAIGLETAHPEVLSRLNKNMTLDQFSSAAKKLRGYGIALRAFILVKPPFLQEEESLYWAKRSLDFAFDCGATVAVLIPTRTGNGAMEALARTGDFSIPTLDTLESAFEYGIDLNRGRVFADLWDLERISNCSSCFDKRSARLLKMNLEQKSIPSASCRYCRDNIA